MMTAPLPTLCVPDTPRLRAARCRERGYHYDDPAVGACMCCLRLMDPPPSAEASRYIHTDPDVRGCEPVIVGTRVPAADVLGLLRDGMSATAVCEIYPTVNHRAAADLAWRVAGERE